MLNSRLLQRSQLSNWCCQLRRNMLSVTTIPTAGDNYMYLVQDTKSKVGAIVDPLEPANVYGGDERVDALNHKVAQDDAFNIGELAVKCFATPCHTSGHICYYVTDAQGSKAVFTGDTLFVAGCGRFFEGTPQQMYDALITKLGSLPSETEVYCGHEYTVKNLQFAVSVEPDNAAVKQKLTWAEDIRKNGKFTVPSTIAEEKKTNPFMRVR